MFEKIDLTDKVKTQKWINKIWREFDRDGSGMLNRREIKKFIITVFEKTGQDTEISDEDFREFFHAVDITGDGRISKSEMQRYFMKLGKMQMKNGIVALEK